MSELNQTPEELIEEVSYEVEEAEVIPTPIDPTLSHPGEAADAKATGDAIRRMGANININGVIADEDGTFHVYPENIPMSDAESAQKLDEVLSDLGTRSGADIMLNSSTTQTVEEAISAVGEGLEEDIQEVSQAVGTVDQSLTDYIASNNATVEDLQEQIDDEFTDAQVHQIVLDVFTEGGE